MNETLNNIQSLLPEGETLATVTIDSNLVCVWPESGVGAPVGYSPIGDPSVEVTSCVVVDSIPWVRFYFLQDDKLVLAKEEIGQNSETVGSWGDGTIARAILDRKS